MDMKKRADDLLEAIKATGKGTANLEIKSIGKVELSPKQCAYLCRQVGLVYHEGLEDRVFNWRLTDTSVDRDGDVIISKGVDISEFKKDGVICAQHEGRKWPIGKALKSKFNPDNNPQDITAQILIYDNEIDATGISEVAYGFANSGAMTGGSIGFDANWEDVRKPSPEEKELYKMPDYGLIFDKIKLIEFSIVTIPSNMNARQIPVGKAWDDSIGRMKEKGAISEDRLNQLRKSDGAEGDLPPPETKTGGSSTSTIKIYISGKDDEAMQDKKMKLAADAKEKGFAVDIIAYEEKSAVTNVVGMTGEQKDAIVDALSAMESLKEKFQNLLDMAGSEKTTSKSPDDLKGSQADDEDNLYSNLGTMLEETTGKLKKE